MALLRDVDRRRDGTAVGVDGLVCAAGPLEQVGADGVEAEIARLLELGATRIADHEEYGYTWTLMADPEGNEFDIARQI